MPNPHTFTGDPIKVNTFVVFSSFWDGKNDIKGIDQKLFALMQYNSNEKNRVC